MVIVYTNQKSIYINLTNRCTNRCVFCVREHDDQIFESGSLWLEREPEYSEVINELKKYNLDEYDEIVFCGYGEPTCRLDDMLSVCRWLRENTKTKIRLNTNGHASLIAGRNTPPEFKGLFDTVSISLNAADRAKYQEICRSEFGEEAFDGMIKFASELVNYVPQVILSVVRTTIPYSDIEKCKAISDKIGAELRVREYID